MLKRIKAFFAKLGAGLVTGASDDDPSGIATYSQAGATFGLSTLWTAFVTFPLMVSIQEMCGRIGRVTNGGLICNLNQHYPSFISYLVVAIIAPAIVLNIAADISAMGAVSHLLIPAIPNVIFATFFTLLIIICMVVYDYKKIAAVLKYLCLSLLLYLIVPFFIHIDIKKVLSNTFMPHLQFNKEYLAILLAILGTTISPYLFFWQATMEAEGSKQKGEPTKRELKAISFDTKIGMLFSNVIMYFMILTTGIVLSSSHAKINSVEDAARALQPLTGKWCDLFFSLGVIGTGLLAIPVLCGSLAYVFTAALKIKSGLNKKLHQAWFFYCALTLSLLLGLLISFYGFNPIKILIYTAILYGILSPILIFFILLMANNRKIMGKHINGLWSNTLGIITFILMTLCAILYLL